MTHRTTAELGAIAVFALLAAACGSDELTHPVQVDDPSVGTTAATSGPIPPGNFPEPALELCGPLPLGTTEIPRLATAWAVSGPMGTDSDGNPIPTGSIRMRFGDFGYGCGDRNEIGASGCFNGFAFSFNLFPENQEPGNYSMGAMEGLYPETFFIAGGGGGGIEGGEDDATCGGEAGGGGSADPNGRGGELVIHRIDANCVVGELIDATQQLNAAFEGEVNGAFAAQRCNAPCVPHTGNPC